MKNIRKQIPYLLLFLYIFILFTAPLRHINSPKLFLIKLIKLPLHFSEKVFYNTKDVIRSKSILQENKILRHKLHSLESKVLEIEELKSENARLREILSFKNKSQFDFITTPIIAKDSTNISNSIVIGCGKKQGIELNAPVITESGLAGRVVELSASTSRVLLITDPNSKISVMNSRSRCEGMLHGISGGLCKMIYLELESDIKEGDLIITSGFSTIFPKGIAIGEVVEINNDPRGLWLYCIVKPKFNLARTEEVLCIK